MSAPLSNIRVLDMSRILAGPWAGQLLGDYGADVVKIERPGVGDDTRQWGPPWLDGVAGGESAYFLSTNRNKRSATVDISNPRGQAVIRDLAATADVLLENYKVGTLKRYGLGPVELCALNPRLIYCSISAFGQSGSRAADPGYDAMIQASAGLMSITGPAGDDPAGPQKVGVAIADIMAGMYATTAVLAALNARAVTGLGQHIDVPLYDSQVAWLANQNMNFLVGGKVPQRMGTGHPNLVPYQAFTTRDGNLMLAVGNDRQFAALAKCIDMPELAGDLRFRRNRDRIANRGELISLLEITLGTQTTAHWLAALGAVGVPAGPINSIDKVLTGSFAEERGLVRQLANTLGQDVPIVSNPVDFSETPVSYRLAPPLLSEHTEEVLREWLGYSQELIAELQEHSAI
ncbi:MAG: CoA transferase [Gammaproteobacteria bacterium]|nr:CoA transferase [Gammaproteobacteria bacterium]MBT8111547.1 CoA transferase [Gammaproteobacteria bacterium]NND47056.1 CoA transferase [Woeseiaceae bacterium]NNL46245.1 CoA transferase [Woeseiaceae bacterium]